jgi:CxxC-x17-CxxC domain-containing protein
MAKSKLKKQGLGDDLSSTQEKARLEKRQLVTPADPAVTPRTKICTKCAKTFRVDPGKKFYLCSDCYRRTFLHKKASSSFDTRILTSIICSTCGTREYLPFVPNQHEKTFCRSCYAEQRLAPSLVTPPAKE